MSATSGIVVSQDLTSKFAEALESRSTRFLKVSIRGETLVHDLSIPVKGSFKEDLGMLQDAEVLKHDVPAYILAMLDDTSNWLAISYVPDIANVKEKMLYASTRASFFKSLGSTSFADTLFATSKEDLTPNAYSLHLQHLAAPKPLTPREQELADLRKDATYEGSRARVNHIGKAVGYKWDADAEKAIIELGQGDDWAIAVITIEPQSETIMLVSKSPIDIDSIGSALPLSEPCYAFFAYPASQQRKITFIYSCPSDSPIKHRMLYSSGSLSTSMAAKSLLASSVPDVQFQTRKIETSDPKELNRTFLVRELGLQNSEGVEGEVTPQEKDANKNFAKPRGPGRRR